MRRKNDILWKGMLEEVFDDLMRFIFPNIDEEVDMERGFEFLDKELSEINPGPDKAAHTRIVDKLVKIYRQDGTERWLLVHVEVQGQKDPEFARRMFTYYYRILDKYNQPVVAIALFTGAGGGKMPDRYEDHCLGTHQIYQYNTLRITDYPDEELVASENPFAIVLLAAKKALLRGKDLDDQLLAQKILIVRLLYERGIFNKKKISAILTFLHNYVLFEKPQTNRIFMEQVDQITGKKNTMGIHEQLAEIKAAAALAKGEKKGIVKGKDAALRLVVENLLKSTNFSTTKIATLTGVSIEFVRKVKVNLHSN